MAPTTLPAFQAFIDESGVAQVTDGNQVPTNIYAGNLENARAEIHGLITAHARMVGHAVRATVTEPTGTWPLVFHPDGRVVEDATITVPQPDAVPGPADTTAQRTTHEIPFKHDRRQSFLTRVQPTEPATRGWRGAATRMGIRVKPSAAERAERADIDLVSQHWPGPRTIFVVNGKGGAGKTPTTILLSAVLARYGGAGVLAWDNNQTRGTLGWRTEQGAHESTLLDLLPHSNRLLGTNAQSADLARFVHHQSRDRFDVLRSQPLALADQQRIQPADVDSIHAVASKYYRLIVVDSGNDESDPMWRAMLAHTDQLVVVTSTRDDHAEAGALLLEGLRTQGNEHAGRLARSAVAVVTQAEASARPRDVDRISTGYKQLARAVVTVPHDPAMVDGHLRYEALRGATQRAWLRAAAAVAEGLTNARA